MHVATDRGPEWPWIRSFLFIGRKDQARSARRARVQGALSVVWRRQPTLHTPDACVRQIHASRAWIGPNRTRSVDLAGDLPDVAVRVAEARGPDAPRPVHRAVEDRRTAAAQLGCHLVHVVDGQR